MCVELQDALVADAGVDMLVRLMMAGGGDAAAEDIVDSASAAAEGRVMRTDDPKTNTQTASKLLTPTLDMLDGFTGGICTHEPLVSGTTVSKAEVRPKTCHVSLWLCLLCV